MASRRVFISHASAQNAIASDLCGALEGQGVSCWVAPRDLPPGVDWVDAIPAGVRSAELVVVLLSTESLSSDWVDRELNWAVRSDRPLMPVLLGDVTPTDRFEFLFGTIQRSPFPERPTKSDVGRLADQACAVLRDEGRTRESISAAEPERAPQPPDPFETVRVSSARPAYFVIVVDHSFSMNSPKNYPARKAVAEVVNEVLYKLLDSCVKADGYVHYFDVSVLGYGLGANDDVRSRLPDGVDRMAVEDLDGRWLRIQDHTKWQELPDGERAKVVIQQPVWVDEVAGHGRTVMAKAFERTTELVRSWIAEHPQSLPPVVMNVTDGAWTGDDPLNAVRALQEQATELGGTLVFNCQIATKDTAHLGQLLYPSEVPEGYGRRTKELFWLSSVLPLSMREEARAHGFDVSDESRGLVYNAPVGRVIDFLQVGTQTLT